MKLIFAVALALLASANAGEVVEPEHDYIYIPDDEGNLYLVDLLEKGEDLTGYDSKDALARRNVDTITFSLFTAENPTTAQLLVPRSVSSVTESNFLKTRPTRFVTHGWRSSQNSNAVVTVRNAYLAEGDYNVIVIDWSSIAGSWYTSAAPSVRGVAARVAEMIDFLSETAGLDFSTTKLVGHSLGAHVSGIAAHLASGKLEGVIGLDPARPLFKKAEPGQRIHQTDAEHVEIIHTNGGFLGIMDTIGDTDFYPNGGSRQPGCGVDLFGVCAHARAYYYFAESITNPTGFVATGQNSYYIEAMDGSIQVFMGGRTLSTYARGSFILNTASSSPFALG